MKITPTALCSGTAITVAGKSTQSGSPVTVNLADCEQDSGKKYLIPVVLTANGQSVTYTVKVQKQATVSVTLNHEEGLDVKVYSQTGDCIAPHLLHRYGGQLYADAGAGVYLSGHQGRVLPRRMCLSGRPQQILRCSHPCHRGLADGSERQNRQQCTVV